ncbi:TPA: hypothetical protein ACK3Q6_006268 [Burkholderia cepacia]|nr:hypothetical protein [Burkholderia cepacia]
MATRLPYVIANAVSNITLHPTFANLSRKAVKVLEILVLAVDKRDPLGPIKKRRDRIVEQSRYAKTTIHAALNELESAGLVTRNEQRGIYGRVYMFLTADCAVALGLITAEEADKDNDKSDDDTYSDNQQQTQVRQDAKSSVSVDNWKDNRNQTTTVIFNNKARASATERETTAKAPVIPEELKGMLALEATPGKCIYPETICKLMGEVRESVKAGILKEGVRLGDLWAQFGKRLREVAYPVAYLRRLINDPYYFSKQDRSKIPFVLDWVPSN